MKLGRGLYCWVGLQQDPWRILAAWRDRLPPDAVFMGLSAAWLYRLDVDPIHPAEVVARTARSRPGLLVRDRVLAPWDVVRIRGLRATSVARTFRDLKRRLPEVELLILADQALKLGLGKHHPLAEPADSPMETRLRHLLVKAGLPAPEVQVDILGGRFRVDLCYPSAKLVIEYDGASHRDRLTEDLRRQNAILEEGYQLLRFTAPTSISALTRSRRRSPGCCTRPRSGSPATGLPRRCRRPSRPSRRLLVPSRRSPALRCSLG